jgi:hypothetical protein
VFVVPRSLRPGVPARIGAPFLVVALGLVSSSSVAAPEDGAAAASADTTVERMEPDSIRVRLILPTVEVQGSYEGSLAPRVAASQGLITPRRVAARPLLRPGDVLETIPGMLTSQHSGEGKANQYYLRGFNLDHGTDFATTIAGVPVNMPTHAHGQGYTDLSFVIPELVSGIQFRKGTYSVEDGDFSSAGSAHISYRNTLPSPIWSLALGQDGFRRIFIGASHGTDLSTVLGAAELIRNDGPWIHPDEYRRVNGLVRYSRGSAERGLSVTAMGYGGRWNATDQIPERAVASGQLSRFGTIDPTDGGSTYRYGLSGEFQDIGAQSLWKASAYVIAYRLNLFSNFTYFLDDTVHGDQFEQADERVVTGLRLLYVSGDPSLRQTIGVQVRHDNIPRVGLYRTEARRVLTATREDHVVESSISPFAQADLLWAPRLRTILGARADLYRYEVESAYAPYSGGGDDRLISPKVSVVMGPWAGLEFFVNGGYGFHSNDARGARLDAPGARQGIQAAPAHFPVPGGPPIERGPLLVRTKGAEFGARLDAQPIWSVSAVAWGLDIASELVFVGDAGVTAPSRPSRRTGVELSGEWRPVVGVHMDADLAYSWARFRDPDPAGDHIPGAVEGVVSSGIAFEHPSGGFADLRLRYFGPRPLIEDNSVRSRASSVLNGQLGYRTHLGWTLTLQMFNLLDAKASDVDYYYTSRLPGERPQGVDDVHSHPQEPLSIRLILATGSPR